MPASYHLVTRQWLRSSVCDLENVTTYDAQCMKLALMQFADNVGPDQTVHLCNLIWAFSVSRHILQYPLIL